MLKLMTCASVFVVVALTSLAARYATAAVVTLDFDSVAPNAGNGPAYLSSYGITLTDVSPAGPSGVVDIFNISSAYSPGSFWTNDNFLMQNGGGAPPVSYTMNFSIPLESISFERIATPFNLTTEPQWSAIAYAGLVPVGTVGESLGSWGNSPAHPFTITSSGITSLTISANGFGFTGIGAVPLDDFVLTQVPEPSTVTLAALGLISLGFVALRKKLRRA
jgi:hypothetical protein